MKFSKKNIRLIEKKLNFILSEDQIKEGVIRVSKDNGYYCISRRSVNTVYVDAKFNKDGLEFLKLNAVVDDKKLAKLLDIVSIF